MEQLHVVAKYLLKHEKIDGDIFKQLMEGKLNMDDDDSDVQTPPSDSSEEKQGPEDSSFWQRGTPGPQPT